MGKEFIAHSENDRGEKHLLVNHLEQTAKLTYKFAKPFGSANAGFVLGLFHDLGKVNPMFQEYLDACEKGLKHEKIPHSICGASYLWKILRRTNMQEVNLAMCALGHHGGLCETALAEGRLNGWWNNVQNKQLEKSMQALLNDLSQRKPESIPENELRRELRLRMLFSALVDADYIDTERHFDSEKSSVRGQWTRPSDLWAIFRSSQLRMMWQNRNGNVNQIRKQVYLSCVETGKQSPGVFRLTVPTGGGKTRSGLGFALSHAVANKIHGFRRIIVALPYTSIIDQNARVYRDIFGDHFVLEHHSQYEIPDEEKQDETYLRQRLAAENWDFPLIVTTTAQLFESLFSNKPSRCRKLHNIAHSILILDEVQTLPPELLEPTMDVLRTLVDEYGVTLVLSTATQPAFDQTPYLKAFDGLKITEIVPRFADHFKALQRVEYQPVRSYESLSDLAEEIAKPNNSQVLVIMNTRKHALALHEELRERHIEGLYHLSTLLCGAHRKRLLSEIVERLNSNNPSPVRLISTQVVEAGVDLDFPVVYRVMGPLDRIVQAAGRCNREGKRAEKGKVVIFDFPDNASPKGAYKIGMDDAKTILCRIRPEQLHETELYTEYFKMLFRDINLDKREIQSYRRDLNYPSVAEKYKLIEDTLPVVITTYDNNEGERRLQKHLIAPSRETWRKLMPFVVNIRYHDLKKEDIKQCVEEISPGLYKWIGVYDDKTHRGIRDILHDPADLVI
jgi:CRISPR-associated endonuclease/helicase Cas3